MSKPPGCNGSRSSTSFIVRDWNGALPIQDRRWRVEGVVARRERERKGSHLSKSPSTPVTSPFQPFGASRKRRHQSVPSDLMACFGTGMAQYARPSTYTNQQHRHGDGLSRSSHTHTADTTHAPPRQETDQVPRYPSRFGSRAGSLRFGEGQGGGGGTGKVKGQAWGTGGRTGRAGQGRTGHGREGPPGAASRAPSHPAWAAKRRTERIESRR